MNNFVRVSVYRWYVAAAALISKAKTPQKGANTEHSVLDSRWPRQVVVGREDRMLRRKLGITASLAHLSLLVCMCVCA